MKGARMVPELSVLNPEQREGSLQSSRNPAHVLEFNPEQSEGSL